jgi:membrane protein implicated in regulation of membrane protease activity
MNMQDIDTGTDILKIAAVFGTIVAAIAVFVGFLLADFAWWIALLAAGGMVWAEAVCWTLVFRQREAARQKLMLAQTYGDDPAPFEEPTAN